MAAKRFTEEQKFKLGIVWLFFIIAYTFLIYAIVQQLFLNKPYGDDSSPEITFGFSLLFIAVMNIIFMNAKLITRIDKEQIEYQFKPFHRKVKKVYWKDVEKYWMRDYRALKEFGWYGVRSSPRNGKAVIVAGKKGLQLITKDGKKILIGTQKPVELEKFIKEL